MTKKRTHPKTAKKAGGKKPTRKSGALSKAVSRNPQRSGNLDFDTVVELIDGARARAASAVNTALIELYWSIGEFITRRIEGDGWGKGTVEELADYIRKLQPNARGYSARNLWRMKQLFETYRDEPELSPLVTVLSWTHNLLILSRCKRNDEREFYLRLASQEKWGKRELERQLNGALFERTVLSPPNLAPVVREIHPEAEHVFRDTYLVDFLQLSTGHSEADLHRGLVENLKQFLIELGRDFCFVGSEYLLQVGGRDFFLDLLFFNRTLNCLVAIELKIEEFQPEHLGKLEFYLEALDRDVRKPHESPAVGVLLCATKDSEVVEYALSRSASPALVAQYQTALPDKQLLQARLHEFYELATFEAEAKSEQRKLAAPKKKAPARKKTRKANHGK